MQRADAPLYAFNAGIASRKGLARTDMAGMKLAGEVQKNLLPTVLGPMVFRPGTEYITSTASDAAGRGIPFVFNVDNTAYLELTNLKMRVLLSDGILTRPSVSTTISNGDFSSLTNWTDEDEVGATSSLSGTRLSLFGTGTNYAAREQEVTVSVGDQGTEHALRVDVERGFVTIRVGSTSGDDDYIGESILRAGEHSLAFTPTGNFWIWVGANQSYPCLLESVEVESSGAVEIATPWTSADLDNVRFDQSGDVLFVGDGAHRPRRIERRSQRSWSVVLYEPLDGPFRLTNATATTLAPSSLSGTATITASRPTFSDGHVGALFRLTHAGERVQSVLGGADQYTDYIRVSGISGTRNFAVIITGTWTATITLQRSVGTPGSWTDVPSETYTANISKSINDGMDNQIVYYRLGIKTGDYTSGSATASLRYSASSQTGVGRIVAVSSSTSATIDVIENFSSTDATDDWAEGSWSGVRGYPSAVVFHDGRLFWGMNDEVFGSVSDAFSSFDDSFEGDAGPIQRTIATGGVDGIHWFLSRQRLIAGTSAQEVSIRASGFDEPLTPTQFTARACSSRGSAPLPAIGVDTFGLFVQRNRRTVFELVYSVESNDYASFNATRFCPEVCEAGISRIAIQRTPDTRIWFVLDDGTCAVLTYERKEEVIAWSTVDMPTGSIEDVCVVPNDEEDEIYFIVNRTIGGSTKRYIEKLAQFSEVEGGTLSKTMDSHVVYSGSSTTTITGLSHLNGEDVVVWANGAPLVTAGDPLTVSSGSVTLPSAATNAVVGLSYKGQFKSMQLAYGAQLGTAMTYPKRISNLSLMMADVAWKGIRIGYSFDDMTGIAHTYEGRILSATEVLEEYVEDGSSFNGGWAADSRLCIEVESPYCATFLGAVVEMQTNERDVPEKRQGERGR